MRLIKYWVKELFSKSAPVVREEADYPKSIRIFELDLRFHVRAAKRHGLKDNTMILPESFVLARANVPEIRVRFVEACNKVFREEGFPYRLEDQFVFLGAGVRLSLIGPLVIPESEADMVVWPVETEERPHATLN